MPKLNKALFIILAVVIAAALGGIVYFAVIPNKPFTEFYIPDYPDQVIPGEDIALLVGVVNQ